MFKKILLLLILLTALAPADTSTPEGAARELYGWLTKVGEKSSKQLPECEKYLTPELYSQLTRAYAHDPADGNFLDFDPWSNSQMGASGYKVGTARMVSGQAKVPISVAIYRGGAQKYTAIFTQSGETWQLANIVYAPDFNLLSVLRDINK